MRILTKSAIVGLLVVVAVALAIYVVGQGSRLASLVDAGGIPTDGDSVDPELIQLGVVQDSRLGEISGIDTSFRYKGYFWVHNDSGNGADIFLISPTGETIAAVKLHGATNVDWEDISVFQIGVRSFICIGDVGDNLGRRDGYQLLVLPEPEIPKRLFEPTTVGELGKSVVPDSDRAVVTDDFRKLEFRFPDGPKNCEAIAIWGNEVLLFEKSKQRRSPEKLGVYRLQLSTELELVSPVAERIGDSSDPLLTGADISADGRTLVVCNYAIAKTVTREPADDWKAVLAQPTVIKIPLPIQRQGESICFVDDGTALVVVSEFVRQPIWKIKFPSQPE